MYCFARWKRPTANGRAPALPRGVGYLLLADCGHGSEWSLFSLSASLEKPPRGSITASSELTTLLHCAEGFPPALALAREALPREGNLDWDPEQISRSLTQLLRRFLREQPHAPYVLIECRTQETGYRSLGEFCWALDLRTEPQTGRAMVRWVSHDFFIYTNGADDFLIPPRARQRLLLGAQSS